MQRLAGDVGVLVGRQIDDRGRDILGRTETVRRYAAETILTGGDATKFLEKNAKS